MAGSENWLEAAEDQGLRDFGRKDLFGDATFFIQQYVEIAVALTA
jgi:hypothetical protein